MKTLTSACLSASLLYAFPTFAADGDLKPALDALHQRHVEALAAATAAATAAVEDEWYLGLKKLRLEAVAKNDGETTKKIEAMLLAAGRNGVSLGAAPAAAAAMAEEKKTGLPEKGSRWVGQVIASASKNPKKDYDRVEATVTSVEGETFLLRTNLDGGPIWDWTFKQQGDEIEVIKFVRRRTGAGLTNVGQVAGVTGTGTVESGAITFGFSWPQPGLVYMGTFELKLIK